VVSVSVSGSVGRSQVQIPAAPLFRRVITVSKLFTRIYSDFSMEGLKMVCVALQVLECQRTE